MKPYTTANSAFWGGVRDFSPVLLGVISFGLIYGVTAADMGFTLVEGVSMSAIMVAGASQLVAIELLRMEAPALIIIFSAAIVNLRFVIYSASLAVHFKQLPHSWRLFLAYFLTDQPYALSIVYYNQYPNAPHKHWYYLGHSVSLWVFWIATSAIGMILGPTIPESWGLGFVIPLMFIGIAVPTIKNGRFLAAGIVAIIVTLVAAPLPNNFGLIIAVACGIATGVLLEQTE